jgi:8-oxo-dGTP pyrophosphatase MutT (NUDIX family)
MLPRIDEFEQLVQTLKHHINQGLPGIEAHKKLAPPGRFPKDGDPYQPRHDTKIAATLMLIYPDENQRLHFPLIVRPENQGVHSGQVSFPGGRFEEEDQDFITCAIREAEEEIGVKIDKSHVIGEMSKIYIPPSNFLVYPVLAALPSRPNFVNSPFEVSQLLEVPINFLEDTASQKIKKAVFKGLELDVPYYDFFGQDVWGATAMILSEFLEIWRKATELEKK